MHVTATVLSLVRTTARRIVHRRLMASLPPAVAPGATLGVLFDQTPVCELPQVVARCTRIDLVVLRKLSRRRRTTLPQVLQQSQPHRVSKHPQSSHFQNDVARWRLIPHEAQPNPEEFFAKKYSGFSDSYRSLVVAARTKPPDRSACRYTHPARLNAEHVPCPAAHTRHQNRHRAGNGWQGSTVRAILCNPRYTGYAMYGRWQKVEELLDPDDVGAGTFVRYKRSPASKIVRSREPARPAIAPGASLPDHPHYRDQQYNAAVADNRAAEAGLNAVDPLPQLAADDIRAP